MTKTINFTISSILLLLFSLNFISALTVDNVEVDKIYPGQETNMKIKIKNNIGNDVTDVSFLLNLENTQFTTIGSSEDSVDSLDDGDTETFSFTIKAFSSAKPGDYNIPYTITYVEDDQKTTKKGSVGIRVTAETELSYNIEETGNVIGDKGKISLKIINSGLGDIGYVNVKVISTKGFEIVSNKEDYIGSVRSDDFELASFDSVFKEKNAVVSFSVRYKDFENNEKTEIITLPVKVYSQEEAINLGLKQKSQTNIYIGIIIALILFFVIRRKRKKKNNIK